MDRLSKRHGLALALSLVAIACAPPTIPNDLGTAEDPNSADSDVTTDKKTPSKNDGTGETAPPEAESKAGPTPAPTPAPAPTPNNCAQQQNPDACFDCCDQASGGALAKADEAFGQCACGGGQCTSACTADFCTGAQPSAACDACLQQTCEPAADALCTSAECKAGQQCAEQCGQ